VLSTLFLCLCHVGIASTLLTRGGGLSQLLSGLRALTAGPAASFSAGSDLWLSSASCSFLCAALTCLAAASPLSLYARCRRGTLRAASGVAASLCCVHALVRVIVSPNRDDWFWGAATVLFSAAAGQAFILDAIVCRVTSWAAADAAAVLGVKEASATAPEDAAAAAPSGEAATPVAPSGERRRASTMRLLRLSAPDWRYVLAAFAALVAAAVGQTLIPGFVGGTIDAVSVEGDGGAALRGQLLRLLLASLATAVFTGVRGWLFTLALARLKVRLRDRLFRALMRQEQGWYDGANSGELLSRLAADTTAVGDQISLNVNVFLRSLITAGGSLLFMFTLSWRLSALAFVTLPPTVLVSRVYGDYVHKISKRTQRRLAECNKVSGARAAAGNCGRGAWAVKLASEMPQPPPPPPTRPRKKCSVPWQQCARTAQSGVRVIATPTSARITTSSVGFRRLPTACMPP